MALTYTTPVLKTGKDVAIILGDVFLQNSTIGDGKVSFNTDIKAGSILTESEIDVVGQKYTGGVPLTSNGAIRTIDYTIVPKKIEYYQDFMPETLRTSRFNETMDTGAWNVTSNEFATKVLVNMAPKIARDAEIKFWGGISAATKTAIAGLTPGAGQGSMTAAAQTAYAGLTADPADVDGVLSSVAYNAMMQAAGLGTYVKVANTTITAANIAAEVNKIYLAINPADLANTIDPAVIYCPEEWRAFARSANNSVGAASNKNFDFSDTSAMARCYYNGVEMLFVPFPTGFKSSAYASTRLRVSWNTDLLDDVSKVQVDKVAPNADLVFVRSIYTLSACIGKQKFGVYYGG